MQHTRTAVGAKAPQRQFTTYGTAELRQVVLFKLISRQLFNADNDVPAM